MTPHRPFKIDSRKMLEWLYDQLYSAADKLFKQYKPCQIMNVPHMGGVICIRYDNPRFGMCCNGCRWLGKKGCTVKALSCKLWYCHDIYVNRNYRKFIAKLDALRDIASRHCLCLPRKPKVAAIDRAYNKLWR